MPFFYDDGSLCAETTEGTRRLIDLARENDGPIYVYLLKDILANCQRLRAAFGSLPISIHYAMKANANAMILSHLAREGLGVDTVSGGEINSALAAGFSPEAIIFSGVGKTRHELELAVRLGIKQINVESPQELYRLGEIACRLGKTVDVAFRMNPDVNPKTHPYITTGFRENKFGMDETFLPELREILRRHRRPDGGPGGHAEAGGLRLRGLTLHIGSQITELDCLRDAINKTILIYKSLCAEGYRLDRFDIGGGLGIDYGSPRNEAELKLVEAYGRMVQDTLSPLGASILTEPGRILVARAGLLIGEVQYIKQTASKTFAILNTGMNHLLRPALYQARHRVLPLTTRPESNRHIYDIVGPICESSDFLAKDVELPEVRPGDFVAMADAGAYGFSMASQYNQHALPREIVLN